jgi:FAD/FMN-containing dehydrogenase
VSGFAQTPPLTNFGGNLTIQPRVFHAPRSEEEVLQILREQRGKRIRAIGRLHSWSGAPQAEEVLLDLRNLNSIQLTSDDQGPVAIIGGGCQIKDILRELDRHGLTLPTIGLISEQSIAGAAATGTHGSGRSSLSHYIAAVRLACYDPATGEPIVREVRSGPELQAARCSLGCMGIVLSVETRPRPQFRVEEWFCLHDTLEEVLAAEADAPLQQFYLVPWQWKFMGQHRRETEKPRSWLARLYRLYWFVTIDVGLHLTMLLLVRVLRSRWAVKTFFCRVINLTVIRGWHVVDKSPDMLIMEHELFRHIEIELFVKHSRLAEALSFVTDALQFFDGDSAAIPPNVRLRLEACGVAIPDWKEGEHYTHHYPICIRRVLPDDTLISMTSGSDEPYYAISFISYAAPSQRAGFQRFAEFLASSMAALFAARPHWGKVCPLTPAQVDRLYPGLSDFRAICSRFDPGGRFRNSWCDDLVLSQPPTPG